MRMIRPSRARTIPGTARLTTRNAPPRFVSTTDVKSSSVIRSTRLSLVIPALATTTDTFPSPSSTVRKAESTDAGDATSHCTENAPSTGTGTARYVAATRSPCAANALAHASPIPRLAPVTRTTRPTSTNLEQLELVEPVPCVDPPHRARLRPHEQRLG